MIKRLKTLLMTTFTAGLLLTPILLPATVSAATADIQGSLCGGSTLQVGTDTSAGQCADSGAESRVNGIVTFIINIFSVIVAIVAVIMIIIGGVKYITSGGDSANVTGAKNTILYAIIGLVIVALAQILVKFVLSKVSTAGQ
jgi:hypothetical protein